MMTLDQIVGKARRDPMSGDAAIYDKRRGNAAILWRMSRWPVSQAAAQEALNAAVHTLRVWAAQGVRNTFGQVG